ncbi:PAS domain S-box protein [Myxococcaceae bacterium GXIMD 01537]
MVPLPVRLADFLRQLPSTLLESWEAEVRRLPAARLLTRSALRDHLPELLARIADSLSLPAGEAMTNGLGNLPDVHALERLGEGFDLEQVVMEYRLLRACVVRRWIEQGGGLSARGAEEQVRFQEAMDEAVAASVSCFARARERTLQALERISAAALGSSDLSTFLPRLLTVLRETVPVVDTVAVLLREGDMLRVEATVGMPDEAGFRMRIGEGFGGIIAATREPRLMSDASHDAHVKGDAFRKAGLQAVYGVPLLLEGEVLGVAHMGSRSTHTFSEEDLLLFRTMAARATALIAQAQSHAREREARAEAEQSLARLRESEVHLKRWREVFTNLGVGVVLVDDASGLILETNPAYARMHGYAREELLGRAQLEVFAPESRPTLPLHIAAVRTRPHHEYESLHLRKDGSTFPVLTHVASFRDEKGEVVLRAGTVMDISHRRAAEVERQRLLDTLENERARLSAVLEQLPVGVVIAEAPSGRLVLGNRRVEEIFGHPFRASEGVDAYAVDYHCFHLDGRPYALDDWPVVRALRDGTAVESEELDVERVDGSRASILVSAMPVRDRDGVVTAAVLTLLDITERRRTEDAVRQAALFGERLIAIVSHDLRNPLNAIQLSATQLLHSEALPPREQRAVARILKAADRMRRMIAELLDFTRGRLGGGIPIHAAPIDYRQLLRQGVEELEAAWPERTVRLNLGSGGFQGRGDADRLAQVVSNLGANALQYSPPETPVTLSLTDAGAEVVLEVHNEGAPIAPDALAHLFDPFRRARQEHSSVHGLGLGLYIVEQVVKGHGGRITVASSAEAGTRFRVTLPRHP